MPQHELEARIDAVDARLVRDTCYKYIYDRQVQRRISIISANVRIASEENSTALHTV
jgi:hypothetical protein